MAKTENLEIPKKLQETDVLIMTKGLIEQKKLELADLNHKILLAKSSITTLQQQQVDMQNKFNQQMYQDKQKLENERNIKLNDLAHREDVMNQGERDLGRRITELDAREKDVLKLEDERKKLVSDRIEVEKLKTQALQDIEEGNRLISEAQSRINIANIKEAEAKQAIAKAEQINTSVTAREDGLKVQTEELNRRIKNLEEVKKEIDPKLVELGEKEKSINKKLQEAELKEANANSKLEEDKRTFAAIEEKLKALKDKEFDIANREEELLRRIATFEANKK